ncbi:galactokinase [candidate division KSB1 bacterium]|nr:galactokinase [candidate division KSB1 bacterium]
MKIISKKTLKNLYGTNPGRLDEQKKRYHNLAERFKKAFGEKDVWFFSTPGRSEIGGNHTDHNHGRVLAAAIHLDSIAIAAPVGEKVITVISEGYKERFEIDLTDLEPKKEEERTTFALLRGIAARFKALGYEIGGYCAAISSDVLPGSGLSSSASIEVLLATIFNALYNDNRITDEELAVIGQYAENVYFNKPSGLMDQMTCAVGGIVTIDFKDPQKPIVKKVNFDFNNSRYKLVVVDTGGNHADLTDDYAAVPQEMRAVAAELGGKTCRDIDLDTLLDHVKMLRSKAGDRAILRAFHFLQDNARVIEQVNALGKNDFDGFLELVRASGNSSFKWLQNIYTSKNVHEQGVSLALALTEEYLETIGKGACRVHGGGFAGTIQVFLPEPDVDAYKRRMHQVFDSNSVLVLDIRPHGTLAL